MRLFPRKAVLLPSDFSIPTKCKKKNNFSAQTGSNLLLGCVTGLKISFTTICDAQVMAVEKSRKKQRMQATTKRRLLIVVGDKTNQQTSSSAERTNQNKT